MAGSKDMKEKNSDLLGQMEARRQQYASGGAKPAPAPGTPPKTAIGQMAMFQTQMAELRDRAEAAEAELQQLKAGHASHEELAQAHSKLAEAEAALAEALQNQPKRKARLDELHEVPGRRRLLTAEQYAELKENLRNNPLANPVTVRMRPEGGFEIIAGNNRVSIYRELGREEIDINIQDLDDDATERTAFYSNLLAPSLSDYEKYLGFKGRMHSTGLNQEEIGKEAGVSQSYISSLMGFDILPREALDCIATKPTAFGATAIQKLAKLVKDGKGERVVEAIRKVAASELNQDAAVRFAAETPATKPGGRPTPITIRQGRSKYCELIRSSKTLRLSFASEDEAASLEQAIKDLLEARAKGN